MVPAALFVMVIVSFLAVAALRAAGGETRSSAGSVWRAHALYVAEQGIEATLANWPAAADALAPGESLALDWTFTPPRRSRYRVTVRRIDNEGGSELYLLSAMGEAPAPRVGGASELAVVAERRGDWKPPAALSGKGLNLDLEDGAAVSGLDVTPPSWNNRCKKEKNDIPGLVWRDEERVRKGGRSRLGGDPPISEKLLSGVSELYQELAERADIKYSGPGNHRVTEDIGPKTFAGSCDSGSQTNWGAPNDVGHQCHDYFPIIHAEGNLSLEGNNAPSQGILLLEQTLTIESDLEFYGLLIYNGNSTNFVKLKGDARFTLHGAAIATRSNNLHVLDGTTIQYSSCVGDRVANRIPPLGVPTPVAFLERF